MIIEGRGLRVVRSGRELLRDVDIAVRPGEVVGVLGPSGAGKSTLFRTLVGELRPDAGTVSLDARDVTAEPLWARARAGVGYVPQTPSVLFDLTVGENLATFLALGKPHASSRPRPTARDLAERVTLQERLDVRAGQLSGGERRRLELARALAIAPRVLVCDEPFAGVDPRGAEALGALLASLAREDEVGVILADHHVEEALRVTTRALLLLDGAVAASGTPDEFREHPLVRGRYLGTIG